MNKSVLTFAISLLALNLTAQTGKPARLALVPETDEVFAACDVLTARLSGDGKLQLLERADIERVYREQGRSAANGDDLKMGRLLGADGLLLLNVIRTPQSTNLLARLVAVKPGVVLTDGSFPWPLRDLKEWTDSVATGIGTFVPKLALSANDAVALSLVNLRSAVQSANASELEQQLKLLAIQRLSRERQLFVLERQKMQLLDEEKTLKAENAAFWSGSYLLDGIVDQSGYSKDTVTINGRLTPPKGGAPLAFEVNGNRTNLTEVINRLALKVLALLKARSSVPEWNATAEATQYFEEAKWALRWGVVPEAQAAADSAWALGKRDQECATIRIKSYQSALSDIPIGGKVLIDAELVADEEKSDRDWLAGHIAEASKSGPVVMVERNQIGLSYTTLVSAPNPQMVDVSRHILALYYEFSRNAPEGLLQAGAKQSERRISAWRALGTEVLATVSRTLEYYYLCPQAQAPVADKLADLRALARSVADWLFQTPAVHDSYFIGDRVATHDELAHSIGEDGGGNANIFRCELRWGSLWQESPEDCIALYRQLMGSPVFCYLHTIFWSHRTQNSVEVYGAGHSFEPPRLVAWRAQDRDRIPSTWNNFVRELNASTNVLLQLEAKAIACTEAKSDAETGLAFTNFFAGLLAHQDALLNNNVEQFYLHWGADELVSIVTGGISSDAKESLRRVYYSQYCPKLDALEREYWIKTVPAKRFLGAFEKQKQYLKENRPYDFFEFAHTFESLNYTTNQALEILPLVLAYKSNLMARSQGASGRQNGQMMAAISQVGFLENNIHRILNPPALPSPAQPKIQPPRVATAAKTLTTTPAAPKAPAAATNVIYVTRFLPIPLDGLPGEQIAGVAITAHHWLEGKLVLDFQYGAFVYSFDKNGNWKSTSNVTFPAIAILDPVTEHWKVISCPAADSFPPNRFYHRTTLWRGEVFTSRGGQIKKFDEAKKVWQALEIAEVGDCELFTVNRHLYAATPSLLLEILDGGTSTRLLASNRRQPPVSTLDTQDLGTPTLFAGPGQSLRAAVGSNIVAWTNGDWHPVCSAPRAPKPPVISEDGVLFLADGWNAPAGIWQLAKESNRVKFWLGQDAPHRLSVASPQAALDSKPAWKLPPEFSFPKLSAASRGPELYLMADHAKSENIVNEQEHLIVGRKLLAQDGYHAELLCFAGNYPVPQKLFLKFERENALPPVSGENRPGGFIAPGSSCSWLVFSSHSLYCGREDSLGSSGGRSQIKQPQTGVWILPLNQIDPEIARQRKDQQDAQARAEAQAKQAKQRLLEKYDRNRNGVLEPAEREDALDDRAFVESELDTIDANHNGLFDAEELAWFDANANRILEPKEQAGIDTAQRLLAEKLLRKFEANADGLLDRSEFNDLEQSTVRSEIHPMPGSFRSFPNTNHDGQVDLKELEEFLKNRTLQNLQRRRVPGPAPFRGPAPTINVPDRQRLFKRAVEAYWRPE